MQTGKERWFGPGDMARKLGVTPKALKVYEREGLVSPYRAPSGWRAYGPAQIAALHRVIALRDLGLTLRRIKSLLSGQDVTLADILKLQEAALEAQRARAERGIALIRRAREKLLSARRLDLDDLITLTRETFVNRQMTPDEFRETFLTDLKVQLPPGKADALIERLKARSRSLDDDARTKAKAAFAAMMADARALMERGDEDSQEAKALVHRLRATAPAGFSPSDEEKTALRQVMANLEADPDRAPPAPMDMAALAFLRRVADGMKARGEL